MIKAINMCLTTSNILVVYVDLVRITNAIDNINTESWYSIKRNL